MKTKSILNAIKKAGFTAEQQGNTYYVVNGNTQLSFHDQDGTAVCLKTKPCDNYGDNNPFNGNCYNSFWSTMKHPLEWLVKDTYARKAA